MRPEEIHPINPSEQTHSGRTLVITYKPTICLLSHFVTHKRRRDKSSTANGYRDSPLLEKCYNSNNLKVRADVFTVVVTNFNILLDMESHRLVESRQFYAQKYQGYLDYRDKVMS